MERKEELMKIICQSNSENAVKVEQLIDEVLFLETRLEELRKLPFLRTNPRDQSQQKVTPASKQYKELLQQYINCLKLLFRISGDDDEGEESPLRQWVKSQLSNANKKGG